MFNKQEVNIKGLTLSDFNNSLILLYFINVNVNFVNEDYDEKCSLTSFFPMTKTRRR